MRAHDIAIVTADTADRWPYFEDQASDVSYVRLHGFEELYVSGYTDEHLDNDVMVHAPYNAMCLAEKLTQQ